MIRTLTGDCRAVLPTLAAGSVQCVVTSPPYFNLRDYGTGTWAGGDPACGHVQGNARNDVTPERLAQRAAQFGTGTGAGSNVSAMQFRGTCLKCGAIRTDAQIGAEPTPDAYIAALVEVFREIRRVLRDDGTVWINLGDSYVSSASGAVGANSVITGLGHIAAATARPSKATAGKAKDLLMIPARVALALQADGWWLRSDIIWCLSGGTRVYARTQKGEMPMTIKDMVRLDPATVQLWNGEKWTQVLGWNETDRPEVTYEIELRNGQRIGCTGNHEWPTQRGNVRADQLHAAGGLFPADTIQTCRLPEPSNPHQPSAMDDEMVGWFVGLYIAEGSQYDGTIQIASHVKEAERFGRLQQLALAFHGTAAVHKTSENGCTVSIHGPMLAGIIETYVSGRIACDKHLHPRCWERSDAFLRAVLDGYLSGDGSWDAANQRWRLGFCNNDELVADLRTIAARLGITVRLRRYIHKIGTAEFPGYKGEVRFTRSGHYNNRDDGEVVAIRESRARKFWDIGVADEPHLFALASGVLTHNSKPNPMPESVTDRPTSAHEHVFLLAKSPRYFFDAVAIAEEAVSDHDSGNGYDRAERLSVGGRGQKLPWTKGANPTRNARNVWTITSSPYPEAHFAVFPAELAERCIKAGTSEHGACATCRSPFVRQIKTERSFESGSGQADNMPVGKNGAGLQGGGETLDIRRGPTLHTTTTGWQKSCACQILKPVPCVVLDPFSGAGTTMLVADRLRRDAVGIELSRDYVALAQNRIVDDAPLFAQVAAQ